MTIVLNGTSGAQIPLGTAAAPSATNTTAQATGLYFPSSTTLGLSTNGTAALTIDASQNVGIGTTSPSSYGLLAISKAGVTKFAINNSSAAATGYIEVDNGSNFNIYSAGTVFIGPTGANPLLFQTNNTERMRIDSSGNVGVGTSSPAAKLDVSGNARVSSDVRTPNYYAYNSAGNYSGLGFYDSVSLTTRYAVLETQIGTATILKTDGATPLIFGTNASERMRIDSSGNVGVGTSSPSRPLTVNTQGNYNLFYSTSGAGDTGLSFASNGRVQGTSDFAIIQQSGGDALLYNRVSSNMIFATNATERMRIDSSGKVLIGTTGAFNGRLSVGGSGQSATFYNTAAGQLSTPAVEMVKIDNNTTTSQTFLQFFINSGANGSGQINANGANTAAFGSFSDERLKENIVNLPPQLENICTLRPVEFDYKDGSGHQIGFVAQEMQEVYPDVVGVGADDMLTITGWSKTEARLVKAIQELKAELDALKGTK